MTLLRLLLLLRLYHLLSFLPPRLPNTHHRYPSLLLLLLLYFLPPLLPTLHNVIIHNKPQTPFMKHYPINLL